MAFPITVKIPLFISSPYLSNASFDTVGGHPIVYFLSLFVIKTNAAPSFSILYSPDLFNCVCNFVYNSVLNPFDPFFVTAFFIFCANSIVVVSTAEVSSLLLRIVISLSIPLIITVALFSSLNLLTSSIVLSIASFCCITSCVIPRNSISPIYRVWVLFFSTFLE